MTLITQRSWKPTRKVSYAGLGAAVAGGFGLQVGILVLEALTQGGLSLSPEAREAVIGVTGGLMSAVGAVASGWLVRERAPISGS